MAARDFVQGAEDVDPAARRRRSLMSMRGVGAGVGVYYGVSAFGYPLGAITGVTQGGAPPATEALGEQFGGGESGGDAGGGTQ